MLAPQALEGVAAVRLLYAAVKRWFGPAAGLLAGLVLALTPVAALMFRFNNPDALLVLLMTAAAYCAGRARSRTGGRAGCCSGGLADRLRVPGQDAAGVPGGAGLRGSPTCGPDRPGSGGGSGSCAFRCRRSSWGPGWWVLIAQLTPAADRPYFGGSTNNNILELAIGLQRPGRLDGTETGSIGFNSSSVGGGWRRSGSGVRRGDRASLRLFSSQFGGQISWLLPAALIALAGAAVGARGALRAPTGCGRSRCCGAAGWSSPD